MKLFKTIVFFCLLPFLLGCSWVQRFMIVNETEEILEINYTIITPSETFAIFESKPEVYALKRKGQINWEKKLKIEDQDTNYFEVTIHLPPQTVLIIGALYNDEYKGYNQQFINGRSFNLVQLNVAQNTKTKSIKPETFDDYFVKRNGNVAYVVK